MSTYTKNWGEASHVLASETSISRDILYRAIKQLWAEYVTFYFERSCDERGVACGAHSRL